VKSCAAKASVSASDGDKDGEVHPIKVSSAVGLFSGRVELVAGGAGMLSVGSDTRTGLPLTTVLSGVTSDVTDGLTLSRKLGAPSRRA